MGQRRNLDYNMKNVVDGFSKRISKGAMSMGLYYLSLKGANINTPIL